jgi:hypothetical protein
MPENTSTAGREIGIPADTDTETETKRSYILIQEPITIDKKYRLDKFFFKIKGF